MWWARALAPDDRHVPEDGRDAEEDQRSPPRPSQTSQPEGDVENECDQSNTDGDADEISARRLPWLKLGRVHHPSILRQSRRGRRHFSRLVRTGSALVRRDG